MAENKTILLFQSSKMKEDIEKISGKMAHLDIPADIQFVCAFTVDESVYKAVNKDPLLQDQKREAILKVYQALVASLGNSYKEANAAIIANPMTADEKIDEMAKKRQAEFDKAFADAQTEVTKIWATLVASQQKYAKYKADVTIRLVTDAIALTAAIASLAAAAASFGGTTIISIIALIKASAKLAGDIKDATKAVEAAVEELKKSLETVADRCIQEQLAKAKGDKKAKLFTAAKMVAIEVVDILEKDIFGTSFVDHFWTSLKAVKHDAKLAKQKVNGANVKAHKLAENLQKYLNKQDRLEAAKKKLEAEIAKDKENGKKSKGHKKLKELDEMSAHLTKIEGTVNNLLVAIPTQLERFKKLDDQLNILLGYYAEIKKQKSDLMKARSVIEKLLALKSIPMAALDASSFAEGVKEMGKAAKDLMVAAAVDQATDKLIETAIEKYYGSVDASIQVVNTQIEKSNPD